MKTCTKCGENKSEEEFHWKVKGVRRKTQCKTCLNEVSRKWAVENRQLSYESTRNWRENNKTKCAATKRRYYENNKVKQYEHSRKGHLRNPQWIGTHNALRRSLLPASKLFCGLTRVKVNAEVRFDYILRDLLTEKTGIQYHVDHIKPLCEGGVHRMWNLAVIPAQVNLKKGPVWFSEDHLTGEDIDAADTEILTSS
jgi:hypothetical protein